MDAGNAFLPGFLERFNERFAVQPLRSPKTCTGSSACGRNAWLDDPLPSRAASRQRAAHALRTTASRSSWNAADLADGLGGQYVDLYHFPDGRLEVRWKGVSLPYRVFEQGPAGEHTAVVENKRLGHALSLIKAAQELKHEPKVQTNSEKLGYKKRPRKVYGPDYEERSAPPQKRWK